MRKSNLSIYFFFENGNYQKDHPNHRQIVDKSKEQRIRHVLVRHEQAAVHAAERYARSTGKPGVVFVTSGPGVTNTVTGLLDAISDSIPIVCISGGMRSPR